MSQRADTDFVGDATKPALNDTPGSEILVSDVIASELISVVTEELPL